MMRSLNDVIPVTHALSALSTILPQNTQLAANNGSVSVNSMANLETSGGPFPALVIALGEVSTARIEIRTWQTRIVAQCRYYDRWDQQQVSIDAVWANVDSDLQRMRSNLEDNPKLTINGVHNALDTVQITLSPYVGQELADKAFPVAVVLRSMTVHINLPPYTSVA